MQSQPKHFFQVHIAEGRYLVTVDYSISSGDFDLGIGNNRLFGIAKLTVVEQDAQVLLVLLTQDGNSLSLD